LVGRLCAACVGHLQHAAERDETIPSRPELKRGC
jgi:hypothetical protein